MNYCCSLEQVSPVSYRNPLVTSNHCKNLMWQNVIFQG
ncbi:hypothetical protein NC651_035860 [Populus alba x Populus x berolinensis]|nr:hypothetical protein NC651_035860 [Populus alba x Populus x berolinensis]